MGILVADTQKSKHWWGHYEGKAAKFKKSTYQNFEAFLEKNDVERCEPLLRESAEMKSFQWLKILSINWFYLYDSAWVS